MSRPLFIGRKAAADRRIYAQHVKEIARNQCAGLAFGIARAVEDGFSAHEKAHIRETVACRAPVRVVRIRNEASSFSRALIVLPKKREPFGIRVGKRTEKRGIRKAENGCVCSDTNREREHSNRGEAWILAQRAGADSEIFRQRFQSGEHSHSHSYANNFSP
jgi:hypothetical protein